MKRIKSLLSFLSSAGVDPDTSRLHQKEVILSNKISLLLIPLSIVGLVMSYYSQVYFTTLGFSIFLVFLFLVLPLNKMGNSVFTKFGLSVLPQLFLLFPNVIGGIGRMENYLAFSYLFIGFAIIPLLLFQDKKSRGFLATSLLINLLVILFFDVLMIWSDNNRIAINVNENNYIYFKLPQIILWILMVSAFKFLTDENNSNSEKLEIANASLRESNEQIAARVNEIEAQNELLIEKKHKIELQAKKLENSQNELKNTKIELLKAMDKLRNANDKLSQQKAEAKSILNALNEHYLVAQYDLEGTLVNINTKVIELLGVLQNEHFKSIKTVITSTANKSNKPLNGHYFSQIWNKVIKGEAHTIELEYKVGGDTKFLATALAPLFDLNNKPYRILAIGQDITQLIDKNEKIDKINEKLKEKVYEISQKNELLSFMQHEIFDKSEELHRQKEEINAINKSLEMRVHERTKVLEEKNKQLAEYAFKNSHALRSPVSTMMGLINLMSYVDLPDEEKKVYEHLKETVKILDDVVVKITNAIKNDFELDRV